MFKFLLAFVLFQGFSFVPGESIAYEFPTLPSGEYVLTIVDDANRETPVPASLSHGDLSFICPSLPHGFYQIEQLQNVKTHRVYYVHVDGSRGFDIQ